jgi:hypothetical protein
MYTVLPNPSSRDEIERSNELLCANWLATRIGDPMA